MPMRGRLGQAARDFDVDQVMFGIETLDTVAFPHQFRDHPARHETEIDQRVFKCSGIWCAAVECPGTVLGKANCCMMRSRSQFPAGDIDLVGRDKAPRHQG